MRKTKKRIYLTTLKNFLAKIFKFGLFPVRSPLVRELRCSLFLRLLRCFTSAGSLFNILCVKAIPVYGTRFPHSDTSGSKVTTHLPEAFRSYVTSFIAILCQGIHHTPLCSAHFLPVPLRTGLYLYNICLHKLCSCKAACENTSLFKKVLKTMYLNC